MGPQPIQWTVTVTNHLKKQLNELIPLSNNSANVSSPHSTAGTPGRGYKGYNASNHHDNTPKPWVSPENRTRFEHRWSYSVRLARWQYFEGLLDQRTFLKWTLDTLAGSGSFEIMWLVLTGIIQDYVDEYKRNRTLTKLLIETLIKSYSAVRYQLFFFLVKSDTNNQIILDSLLSLYVNHNQIQQHWEFIMGYKKILNIYCNLCFFLHLICL